MQEVRKSQNQDLIAGPAWSINSGKMESRPGLSLPQAPEGGRRLFWHKKDQRYCILQLLGPSIGRTVAC